MNFYRVSAVLKLRHGSFIKLCEHFNWTFLLLKGAARDGMSFSERQQTNIYRRYLSDTDLLPRFSSALWCWQDRNGQLFSSVPSHSSHVACGIEFPILWFVTICAINWPTYFCLLRYYAVLKPLNLKEHRGKIMIAIAWTLSALFSAPQVTFRLINRTFYIVSASVGCYAESSLANNGLSWEKIWKICY